MQISIRSRPINNCKLCCICLPIIQCVKIRCKIFLNPSVQFSRQSCPTLCDPMNRSMPGLPVRHQLPEFTQTHVHRVSDAIQPCHPLSSPSPPAPNASQHQSLYWAPNCLKFLGKAPVVILYPLCAQGACAPVEKSLVIL